MWRHQPELTTARDRIPGSVPIPAAAVAKHCVKRVQADKHIAAFERLLKVGLNGQLHCSVAGWHHADLESHLDLEVPPQAGELPGT